MNYIFKSNYGAERGQFGVHHFAPTRNPHPPQRGGHGGVAAIGLLIGLVRGQINGRLIGFDNVVWWIGFQTGDFFCINFHIIDDAGQ